MIQESTPNEYANSIIEKAARRASIIFTSELWTYSEKDGDVVPGKNTLKETILELIHRISDSDTISTGRISLEKDELAGGYAIHLEIGTLSQEEMDALDTVPRNILEEALEQFNKNNGS